MKVIKFVLPMLVLLVAIGCDKESHGPSRSFYMGFTPVPYETSMDAVNWTYQHIAENADIINHQLDKGIPWVEAAEDAPLSQQIMDDWSFRKHNTPQGHKVIVSVAALNLERNGLARYLGPTGEVTLPEPWNAYQFDAPEVKTAYLNYCKRAINYFNPDYFNMNVEANLLYFQNPALWNSFLNFHQYIYEQLKSNYPNLTIFSSVTGAQLLQGYIDGNDHVQQRLAALQILELSDLYGLSFYPFMSKYLGNPYPKDSFEKLFTLTDKPIAIAETGYPAQALQFRIGADDITIYSDEQKQEEFMKDLLEACEKQRVRFVVVFTIRDYDQLWQANGANTDISMAWRDTGIFDENGRQRLAYPTWKKHFDRQLLP